MMIQHPWHTIFGQPPSKSNSYKIIYYQGHPSLGKTRATEEYENSFYMQVGPYKNLAIQGFFELEVRVYFSSLTHDLDNSLKVMLDCLQHANAIKNDNRCTRIVADKFIDKNNPRIEFRLIEVGEVEIMPVETDE